MAVPLALRVAEAEARIYRRTWRGSVFSSFLNPVLYLLAMGVGLGTLVDANLPEGLDNVSYLTFLAPGLLVATAMQTGAGEAAGFRDDAYEDAGARIAPRFVSSGMA